MENNITEDSSSQVTSGFNCKTKRDRSRNFLPIEREQLLQICSDFLDVIENKKNDSLSCKKKYEAWMEIAKMFNAIQTTGPRSDKNLKTLYDNIKRDAKRPKNGEKVQLCHSSHYVNNATSLCNVLINESPNSFKIDDCNQSSCSLNDNSNLINSTCENERLNIKEEASEAESENGQLLSSSYNSSKDSVTSDCNYSSHFDQGLVKNGNHNSEHAKLSLPSEDESSEYHKVRLKYLEIEHRRKMEILDLEQECLLLKRDYLTAKLKALNQ